MKKAPPKKTSKKTTASTDYSYGDDEEDFSYDDDEYDDADYGNACTCRDCMADAAARKKARAKKAANRIIGRVPKVKHFIDTTLAKLDEWIGEEKYSECEIVNNTFDFTKPKKYFVHVVHDQGEGLEGKGRFMTKTDIMKMLNSQISPGDLREIEDRIVIFDTDLNRVVKPKVILE